MSIEALRQSRNMPFLKRGMRCDMNGKSGNVTSANGYVYVRFDGNNYSSPCHPWWQMAYYDDTGQVVQDYKEAK